MMVTNSRASASESEAKWGSESEAEWASESEAEWTELEAESDAVSEALSAAELAAVPAAFSCLFENWTDGLNCTRRMMMENSRREQSIPISREGLNIVVTQRHGGDRVTEIRRPRHRLCSFDNAEEVALAIDQAGCKLRGENARLNFPNLFLNQNRAAESTAPPRTEFPPTPAQQRNPEEDPGSGRSEAMAAAVDNEVEGLGWGSGTGEGERRKILEIENKKACGVRIIIPLEDIQKYSEMSLVDAAKNLNVSRSTLKRVCRDNGIPRWPPRNKIIRPIPQLNSNDLQHGPSNQASSSSIVVHTNQPQLSSAKKQPDTDADREMRLSSFKQPNDENIVTIKARYVNGLTIRLPISWPSSGLVELEQEVAKRLDLEAGTYHIKYKDEENDLILIACDEDFQNYVRDARSKSTSLIMVFLEPKHAAN